jgi:hypothetical protein
VYNKLDRHRFRSSVFVPHFSIKNPVVHDRVKTMMTFNDVSIAKPIGDAGANDLRCRGSFYSFFASLSNKKSHRTDGTALFYFLWCSMQSK